MINEGSSSANRKLEESHSMENTVRFGCSGHLGLSLSEYPNGHHIQHRYNINDFVCPHSPTVVTISDRHYK